jgi:hypothetical protein
MRLWIVALRLLGALRPAHGQTRGYVGGAVGVAGDMQSPWVSTVGGKTWSGTVCGGAHVSPRLSIELEGAFGGTVPGKTYVYRPSPSLVAEVDQHGRHTFLTILLRATLGGVEPVAGVSWVRSTFSHHAVFVPGGDVLRQ